MGFNRLPTRDVMFRRNISVVSTVCPVCEREEESVDHIFIMCEVAQVLWCLISQWCKVLSIYAFSMQDLVELHKHLAASTDKSKAFHTVCLITIWCLWKKRNDRVHNGNPVLPHNMFEQVKANIGYLWVKSRSKRRGLTWEDWRSFRWN